MNEKVAIVCTKCIEFVSHSLFGYVDVRLYVLYKRWVCPFKDASLKLNKLMDQKRQWILRSSALHVKTGCETRIFVEFSNTPAYGWNIYLSENIDAMLV